MSRWIIAAGFCAGVAMGLMQAEARADSSAVERGKYLVAVMSCTDCHTDGALIGKPDMEHFLGGSSIGFEIPGHGFFYGPNLTSDVETGLGSWSETQIATALTKGVRPDGRELAPVMPWRSFANLMSSDALAIAAYLKSLPPAKHKVPGPFGVGEKPTAPYLTVVVPPK